MDTKKQIIEKIQEVEKELDSDLHRSALTFGYESEITQKNLARWATIYGLMQDLGIERGEA